MTEDDDIACAGLRLLSPADVSVSRAHRLRGRCRAELRRRTAAEATPRPLIVPALIGAWSVIYLIGMLRAAAALYGF
jgi:hypothetical protein